MYIRMSVCISVFMCISVSVCVIVSEYSAVWVSKHWCVPYLLGHSSSANFLLCSCSTQLYYDGTVIATFACSTMLEREEWLRAFEGLRSQGRLNPVSQGMLLLLLH